VSPEAEGLIEQLFRENSRYHELDRTVHLGMLAARNAFRAAKLSPESKTVGVNIGSSRGATGLWEKSFAELARAGRVASHTSPATTLGNVSSWVAQDLMTRGFTMSHSVTCSTGLHALLNAVAWTRAGFCEQVIAGASEAALTPFTIAQMKALRI